MRGPQGKMLGEAIGHLKNMAASGRVDAFRNFAQQITTQSRGAWTAVESAATNGTMFVGGAGRTLVFSPTGQMYIGNITNAAAFRVGQGGVTTVVYDALQLIK